MSSLVIVDIYSHLDQTEYDEYDHHKGPWVHLRIVTLTTGSRQADWQLELGFGSLQSERGGRRVNRR